MNGIQKTGCGLVLLVFFHSFASAHKEPVHQFIVREAYKLLAARVGEIPAIRDHVGYSEVGERAWQTGRIVTGAWREDSEDAVYNISLHEELMNMFPAPVVPDVLNYIVELYGGQENPLVSISHFWRADLGVDSQFALGIDAGPFGLLTFGPFPNALQKLKCYEGGRSWILRYRNGYAGTQSLFYRADGSSFYYNWLGEIGFEYQSLVDLFQTGRAWIVGTYNEAGVWVSSNIEVRLTPEWREIFVWEILGRMAHLISDMNVPAHSHNDEHGLNPDRYENWVATAYSGWDFSTVLSLSGQHIDPFVNDDPLYFLTYFSNQIADHYASDDRNGNDVYADLGGLASIVPTLGVPTTTGEINENTIVSIRDKSFAYSIRATAGLFYWFAVEAGMLSIIRVPQDYATIGQALDVATDGQVVTMDGSQTVSSYLTVNSGVTLYLNPGSSLVFNSESTRLLVYGSLNVNGATWSHVILDGQGYSRSGSSMALVVVASGGTASIQYADFKNAPYELTLYNSTGLISVQNCTFTNFGYSSTDQAITVQTKTSGSATISSNTITGSNSQGTAIYLYNTGTNVTLSSNTITNAGTGIRCSSSDAFLTSNTIHNHTNYGIQADNVSSSAQYRGNDIRSCVYGMSLSSASPWAMYNIVIQNGLNVLVNSCSPSFATLPSEGDDLRGHNTIAHTRSPLVKAQYSAFPYLGYDFDGGYNSIFDSDLPDGWVVNNSGLYAANNYWTGGYPSCYVDGTSWALTTNPLPSNPNSDPLGRVLFLGPGGNLPSTLSKTGTTPCDSAKDREFQTALSAAVHGDLSAAVPGLQTVIHSASPKYAPLALLVYYDLGSGRWNSASELGHTKTEMYSLLQDLRSQRVSTLLRPFALRLLARDAAVSRNNDLANTYRNEILKDYNHSDHELVTMYDLVVYYVEAENDFKEAKAIVKKMKHAYPDANLTYMARIEIGEKVTLPVSGQWQPSMQLQDGEPLAMKVADVPTEFSLSQNYPNPFNPSTSIQYGLSKLSTVTLKIFNTLGQEVRILVDERQSPGYYQVQWNANVASGIYIYRLQAGEFMETKKLIVLH